MSDTTGPIQRTHSTDVSDPLDLVVAMAQAHGDLVTVGYNPKQDEWRLDLCQTDRRTDRVRRSATSRGKTPADVAAVALAETRSLHDNRVSNAARGLEEAEAERARYESALGALTEAKTDAG